MEPLQKTNRTDEGVCVRATPAASRHQRPLKRIKDTCYLETFEQILLKNSEGEKVVLDGDSVAGFQARYGRFSKKRR
ncbi:hypothetical protein EGT71_10820 [Atlantibacter subterranea]|uniref:Uncharacterized protein n=1 Tax=Atlantibacter subterraneus TaxID=255519 RepID=A0A3R9LNP3_9ENTR|nr:hypothetical protein EGK67_11905 [Atlantibacter subterranea]RSE07024.1 hypothetical protein EGT84_06505 [Atlantibacter subterranea]RSE26039.1 hypothetical protein EGT71_10820 [Atlantibacter subterranea]